MKAVERQRSFYLHRWNVLEGFGDSTKTAFSKYVYTGAKPSEMGDLKPPDVD